MASLDYDVVIIGPWFGGRFAAFRGAEKGHRAGVMQSGKRLSKILSSLSTISALVPARRVRCPEACWRRRPLCVHAMAPAVRSRSEL